MKKSFATNSMSVAVDRKRFEKTSKKLANFLNNPVDLLNFYISNKEIVNECLADLSKSHVQSDSSLLKNFILTPRIIDFILEKPKPKQLFDMSSQNSKVRSSLAMAFSNEYLGKPTSLDLASITQRLKKLPSRVRNSNSIVDNLHHLARVKKDGSWLAIGLINLIGLLKPKSIYKVLSNLKSEGKLDMLLMCSGNEFIDSHGTNRIYPRESLEPEVAALLFSKLKDEEIVFLLEDEMVFSHFTDNGSLQFVSDESLKKMFRTSVLPRLYFAAKARTNNADTELRPASFEH